MSAATQGSKERCVEAKTSDGSASMEQETALKNVETVVGCEKPTQVATRSNRDVTDKELLGHSEDDSDKEETFSDCSTHTLTVIQASIRNNQPGLEARIKLHL